MPVARTPGSYGWEDINVSRFGRLRRKYRGMTMAEAYEKHSWQAKKRRKKEAREKRRQRKAERIKKRRQKRRNKNKTIVGKAWKSDNQKARELKEAKGSWPGYWTPSYNKHTGKHSTI